MDMKMYYVNGPSNKRMIMLVRIIAVNKEQAEIIWDKYLKDKFRPNLPVTIARHDTTRMCVGYETGFYHPFTGEYTSVERWLKIDSIIE